jgi:hypothetical protein
VGERRGPSREAYADTDPGMRLSEFDDVVIELAETDNGRKSSRTHVRARPVTCPAFAAVKRLTARPSGMTSGHVRADEAEYEVRWEDRQSALDGRLRRGASQCTEARPPAFAGASALQLVERVVRDRFDGAPPLRVGTARDQSC